MHTPRFVKTLLFLLAAILIGGQAPAQAPQRMTSGEIYNAIEKLGVLGTALYVAAHPDDENTRLISYLSNERKVHTTYLSLTRGDGGQNLVGPEIRELLGLIRTQELLMARQLDGGHQRFTRANDFGYSKTPDETLEIWDKDDVLADMIWTIRTLQPDIIINRFPHDRPGGHGHHTASAMLSYEAFDLSAKSHTYPEQLKYTEKWQPRRLFFDTFWWFYGSQEAFEKADKSRMLNVDVGIYYPTLALSNTEIAAMSRSMHKSQGFGSAGTRGTQAEYLELLKGDMPAGNDPFAGIDLTWNRVKAPHIDDLIAKVISAFDHADPAASVPDLVRIRSEISKLGDSLWKQRKLAEIETIIAQCMGLFAEVLADDYWATPGDSVALSCEVVNRSDQKLALISARFNGQELFKDQADCAENAPVEFTSKVLLPAEQSYTTPYWLSDDWTEGMYRVDDQTLRGLPETPRDLGVTFTFELAGAQWTIFRPVVFKRTDPVKGEVYRPFEVVPPAFVNLSDEVMVFADTREKALTVRVKSATDDVRGALRIVTPEGWTATPAVMEIALDRKGDEQVVAFSLTPPAEQEEAEIRAELVTDDGVVDLALIEIDYDHIPHQTILRPAVAKVVKVDLRRAGDRIGYIMGAGDEVPGSLEQVGYDVDLLDENHVDLALLKQYDAIILGVRTYNTSERIRFIQSALFQYVEQGGTLVTQYNTSRRTNAEQVAPYPLNLSRVRVTDESAKVEVLAPDHPVMHYPNKITSDDFDGWVQERGLYFADEWDAAFVPVLRMHDPGEEPADGSLLIAPYGEGHFVYTSLSWFRQLPAGVPGAFRLFTNLISLGQPSRS